MFQASLIDDNVEALRQLAAKTGWEVTSALGKVGSRVAGSAAPPTASCWPGTTSPWKPRDSIIPPALGWSVWSLHLCPHFPAPGHWCSHPLVSSSPPVTSSGNQSSEAFCMHPTQQCGFLVVFPNRIINGLARCSLVVSSHLTLRSAWLGDPGTWSVRLRGPMTPTWCPT